MLILVISLALCDSSFDQVTYTNVDGGSEFVDIGGTVEITSSVREAGK